MTPGEPRVGILMGSASDHAVMAEAGKVLDELGVAYEMTVASAHRTPDRVDAFVKAAETKGIRVLVAGAGGAAHLAGVLASKTTMPVIAVPLASSPLAGFDALLSSVQMPPGIPVATVSVGPWGARNAAILAAQILATADAGLRERLAAYRKKLAAGVEKAAAEVEAKRTV
ncbi:MAG TPA: 5-(carboxyamino)imidazole ribonucleotide mutase [Candidatus Saccharimonadales bacterium]|nr:5-(carboxyamino)imidazole ribonucleotide mutase [Candidatus Saccharimonadales bacterium]